MCPSPRVNDKKNAFKEIKIFFFVLAVHLHMRICSYTAISRKVVGKNVHATIPKRNMGYDQYTFPDSVAVESKLCCFPLAVAHIRPWPFVPILSYVFEEQRTENHTQYPSRLSRRCTFSDNLSRNSCKDGSGDLLEQRLA